ncbi:MAG TPA: metal-dependent hydrolase, partial [Kofleriaceae bacterium]|nr:metal-dependent hydrolase [Kofleriaceae bacterium]
MSIVPRDLDVDFTRVPRHWMFGSPTATAIANGVNLLFPHGERFFVRSVKHFLDQIEDPALRAGIKGFFGQEGRHAHAHYRFNQILRAPGCE